MPIDEFRRLEIASFELQKISVRSESELERLAFDALVAESRLEPRLSLRSLDPAERWSELWILVGARHAVLDLVRSYLDLLDEWADIANEGAIKTLGRGLRLRTAEETRVNGALRRVRASAERFQEALASVGESETALRGGRALVRESTAAGERVLEGIGRNATAEGLWALMEAAQPHLASSAEVLLEIEERVDSRIERMTDSILESYNAARPPAFRSDRLRFDAQAILRVARAARIERLSSVMQGSARLVPAAHAELWHQRASTGNGLVALGQLEVLVSRGPERVRNAPPPVEEGKAEARQAPDSSNVPEADEIEEAWKSWRK